MNWSLIVNIGLLAAQLYLVGLLWRRIAKFDKEIKDLLNEAKKQP